jgi:hypothetical protein
MSGFLSKTIRRVFSLWLMATLGLAPAASAFADCLPDAVPSHQSMAHGEKSPCDTPCAHCEDDGDQQPCKGHCAGMTVSIAPSTVSIAPSAQAARVSARHIFLPIAFARPPDTPPPRSLPV